MPLSVFNHYVPDFPEPGETLVHNTFSGAYVVLDTGVVDALRKADRGQPLDADEAEAVADPDLRDPDVAVVVDDLGAEEEEFRAWFERRRDRKQLDCIVGVNLACNFACTYCSQAQIMDGSVMKPETARQTAAWLAERAIGAGVEHVHLAFIGGEPLLHPGRIEDVAVALRARLPEGISFGFGITTNGYYLDHEMLNRLIPLGLEHAQVTIDGDQSTHCTTRVSKKGEDTYRRIFDHTIAASRRIRVTVNGNYTPATVHSFQNLLAELSAAGLPAGSKVSFSPALEGLASPEGVGGCGWRDSDTSYDVAFHDASHAYGFTPNELGVVGPCELHDLHSFAIEPSGNIYKCPGFLGQKDWAIGHVSEGIDEDGYRFLIAESHKPSHCSGCSHRPNCGGGCLASEWLRMGNTRGVSCEKPYFERAKSAAAMRGYALAVGGSLSHVGPADHAVPIERPTRRIHSSLLNVIATY